MKKKIILLLLIHLNTNCAEVFLKQKLKEYVVATAIKCFELSEYLSNIKWINKVLNYISFVDKSSYSDYILIFFTKSEETIGLKILSIYEIKKSPEPYDIGKEEIFEISLDSYEKIKNICIPLEKNTNEDITVINVKTDLQICIKSKQKEFKAAFITRTNFATIEPEIYEVDYT